MGKQMRGQRKSVAAAIGGMLLTLVIFTSVFLSFLVAPLLALLVAVLAFVALRPRPGPAGAGSQGPHEEPAPVEKPAHAFGSGAR